MIWSRNATYQVFFFPFFLPPFLLIFIGLYIFLCSSPSPSVLSQIPHAQVVTVTIDSEIKLKCQNISVTLVKSLMCSLPAYNLYNRSDFLIDNYYGKKMSKYIRQEIITT